MAHPFASSFVRTLRTLRPLRMRGTLTTLAAVALAACYDWQIGAGPVDAAKAADGTEGDASGLDAVAPKVDVGTGSDARRDALGTPDGAHPGVDGASPHDASAPSCAALAANVSEARAQAQSCTLGSTAECMTALHDACGCNTYVANPSSAATSRYATALAMFADAGCPASCTSCLDPTATTGTCLEMDTGSGVTSACSP
jgi:hypothetical protein